MNHPFPFRSLLSIVTAFVCLAGSAASAATTNVTYDDFFFSPSVVTIHVGDTVNWVPAGSDTHTLEGTGTDPICGGNPLPCNHVFDAVGAFPYECQIPGHAQLGMTGMVVVVSVVVPVAPVIAIQPQNQTVVTNSSVMLSVTSTNALSYQWQTNTVDIPGATNSSLTLNSVGFGDAATYRVVLSNATGITISSNAVLTVLSILPPVILTQPQSQVILTNTTLLLSVVASNAAAYQWQTNSVALAGATDSSLSLSNVVIGNSGSYRVVVTNISGMATSAVAVVVVGFPVNFTQQPSNADVVAGTPVTFQSMAGGLPSPSYQWFFNNAKLIGETDSNLFVEAATTAAQGTYSVLVSNSFGALAGSNAVLTVEPLTTVTKEKLTVVIDPPGSGAVAPNLNNSSLIVAHSYKMAAVPARGQVFKNWTGILESSNRSLSFVMPSVSNATLTAHFVASPFAANGVAGAYAGLFWDTNHLSNETAGYFSASIAATGVISGQMKIAGLTVAFSTNLSAEGGAVLTLKRHNLSSLVLTLQADLTGLETLTGTVSDVNNSFNATLTAFRSGFSAANHATGFSGYYTWTIPGVAGAETPNGYSYGTATVAAAGGVHLGVFLADGTATVASGSLATNGQMPLYVSLYGGKGSLLSWISFNDSATALSTNDAFWFKDLAGKGTYPNGFTLTNLLLWSGLYTPEPHGIDALNDFNISAALSGADLAGVLTQTITLNANGANGSISNVNVAVTDNTGLFSGSFKDATTGKVVHFKGAVLRPVPAGYGFFESGNLSGAAVLQPQ